MPHLSNTDILSIYFLMCYIIRTSIQPLLLYDALLFLLIYLNHNRLHKTPSYHSYSLYVFTILILKLIYIYANYYVFIFTKVIDIVMLMRYSHLLNTTDMQYAFRKRHSTVMCTLVLKEVINYYLNFNSDVYTCFIDATMAFDYIRYDKLFQILIDRGMPALTVRSMLDLYQRQVVRTVWKGHLSRSFGTCNKNTSGRDNLTYLVLCVHGCVAEVIKS